MHRTLPRKVLRFIASIPVIVLLTAQSSAPAQQKPAPPSPASQTQLDEHFKELEKRLNEAEQKAASAAMEKDYITRVQKQYETYYKEVLSTQNWTLGIFGFILTAVFFLAGRFGLSIFDRQIDLALRETSAQLRTEFTQLLEKQTQALRDANDARLKALEDGLTKKITEQEQDLKAQADYQFQFAQGLGFLVNERWGPAIKHFRMALFIYKAGQSRNIFKKFQGNRTTANIFRAIRKHDEEKFEEAAKKELKLDVYNGLEDELDFAATEVPDLAPLVIERQSAPSAQVAAELGTSGAAPAKSSPAATPNDDK